ncbi:sister chromatid cohesion 1 protein [Medicago truncatula]|uniref:Sister chromatid cohesion 1 protein n=1 Tax=Medicago truncatula TaxID=3880 RepID=A0A072U2P0_MEDTR|nr:sister chromatid cohesion 1 protein [Medicago truncatula]
MFYSQFILAKKGPLGTIWIAAHLERKLRKNQVADTDIGVSVDSILFPEVPIALRLSSHLLLGVVRIYSRKVNYLFDDCSEALLKVKQAFRSAAVDLPPEESTAPYNSITLPETFDLDDFELPDSDIFQGNYVDRHVSSKEQITLQDTLEGMVYKTSQFGLDERFGDGDASQIGLDLDEVMLIDKDVTLEHNDFSANPQLSHQEDEKKEEDMLIDNEATLEHEDFSANPQVSHLEDEMKEVGGASDRMQVEDSGSKIDLIDGLPTTAEFHEYAQGPSTPGLQEPNLFGTQADQVINEANFHNSADLLSMETTQNESSAHQTENDVIGCSLQNNEKHVGVDLHHEASDCVLAEVDDKREEPEHFKRTDQEHEASDCVLAEVDDKREEPEHLKRTEQENLILNDHCLASVPLMESSNKDHTTTMLPECASGLVDASGILEKVENLHDGVLMDTEPVIAASNETVNVFSGGVGINDTIVSPSCSHVTSEQDGLSCKLLPNVDGSHGYEFDGHLVDDNTLTKHEVSNSSEISRNEERPCVVDEAQVSNIVSSLESSGRPEVVDVEAQASRELKEAVVLNHVSHEAEQPTESYLRPCTSHINHHSQLSIEGENCHAMDVSDPALGNHDTVEPSACEGMLDLEQSGMQAGSQMISNKTGSLNESTASDIPEPEKMLSAYQHDNEMNHLLLESTPGNQGISEGNTNAAGVTSISGKKRSYTESTLTMQSMDLVESYGGAQSKRTAESIPDDDDLLSSILVGRKSSAFKIKPSPAAREKPSTKRLRSTPRTSTVKRKVLMDDMMVLHGDTIRQQLTSTEDIRRVRKKAPCTRDEILMIQRQFLEDQIFHKPIFTDVSADLTILQNETLDLSRIKVCHNGLDSLSLEKGNDQESYSKTNAKTHGVEEHNEPMAVQPQENAEESYSKTNAETHGVEAHNEPMAVQPQEDAEESFSKTNAEIHGVEAHNEPTAIQPQEDAEAQPSEIPVPSECHQSEVDFGSHNNIEAHGHTNIISDVRELGCSQTAEMNNAGINFEISSAENYSFVPGHETLSLTEVFENELCRPNFFDASLPLMDKTDDLVGSIHTDMLSIPTSQKMDSSPMLENEFAEDQHDRNNAGATEIAENAMEIRTQVETDSLEADHLYASMATGSKEANEYTDNQVFYNGDLPVEENGNNMLGGLNEDQIISPGLGCDDKDAKSGGLFSENVEVDCLHSAALINESSLNDEENPVCQEAALQNTMYPDVSAIRSPFADQTDENNMGGIDTGFLNVGDDEIIEDDDDDAGGFASGAEGTHLENSGWSSRTRAVAKYLQTLFDKEELHGRQNLHLDNILAGKTRKEASRMFFETLVLKTRDYVHVEQAKPFANINLQPRKKLMKTNF